jgi:hypothetical protein
MRGRTGASVLDDIKTLPWPARPLIRRLRRHLLPQGEKA